MSEVASLESQSIREVPEYIARIEELESKMQERIKFEEELKLKLKQIEHKLEYITNKNGWDSK